MTAKNSAARRHALVCIRCRCSSAYPTDTISCVVQKAASGYPRRTTGLRTILIGIDEGTVGQPCAPTACLCVSPAKIGHDNCRSREQPGVSPLGQTAVDLTRQDLPHG